MVGELQQIVERSGRGDSIQAVLTKMLSPSSVPVFSMSAPLAISHVCLISDIPQTGPNDHGITGSNTHAEPSAKEQ